MVPSLWRGGSPRLRRAVHGVCTEPVPTGIPARPSLDGPTAAGQRRTWTGFPREERASAKVPQRPRARPPGATRAYFAWGFGLRTVRRGRRHRRAQLADGGAQLVDLAFERSQPVDRGIRRRGTAGRLLQQLVALPQHACAVALFGDVATEQRAGRDVDGVVLEEVVEDIGLVTRVEAVQLQRLHLLEIGTVRRHERDRLVGVAVVLDATL